MWASEKGWLLPNDAGSRSTCGTVQVAKWAKTPQWPRGTGERHHWKIKTRTWTGPPSTPGRSTRNKNTITGFFAAFSWQMEELQGWNDEGAGTACVSPPDERRR